MRLNVCDDVVVDTNRARHRDHHQPQPQQQQQHTNTSKTTTHTYTRIRIFWKSAHVGCKTFKTITLSRMCGCLWYTHTHRCSHVYDSAGEHGCVYKMRCKCTCTICITARATRSFMRKQIPYNSTEWWCIGCVLLFRRSSYQLKVLF